MPDDLQQIAARMAAALDLIVNCDAFAEPFASPAKRDEDAEEVRQQRIEDVLAVARRALEEYRTAGVSIPDGQVKRTDTP